MNNNDLQLYNDPTTGCIHFANTLFSVEDTPKKITLHPYQENLLNHFANHDKTINLLFRQSGKSMCTTIYALWNALFIPDSKIGLMTHSEHSRTEQAHIVRRAIKNLPQEFQGMVIGNTKNGVEFNNGSHIRYYASTQCSCAMRGASYSLLMLSECAHFSPNFNLIDVLPVISNGGQLHMISSWKSPSTFATAWKDAVTANVLNKVGIDTPYEFIPYYATWEDHPALNDAWKTNQVNILGEEMFAAEFELRATGMLPLVR